MSSGSSGSRSAPAMIWAALVIAGCLFTLGRFVHPSTRGGGTAALVPFVSAAGPGGDYYQFWLVGRAASTLGLRNVYATESRKELTSFGQSLARSEAGAKRLAQSAQLRRRMIQTFSTPFLYAVIGSLGTNDYERDFDAYLDLCLAALLLSILAVGFLLGYSLLECTLFATLVLVCSAPLGSELWWGNVNSLQLGGVALYLLSRRWPDVRAADAGGGFVLGLLVAFKPTLAALPLLLGIAWCLDRRWSALRWHGGGAAFGLLFAFAVGGRFLGSWAAWQDWLAVLPTIDRFTPALGNYSLARMLSEAWGGVAGVQLVSALVLFATVAVAARLLWATRLRAPEDALPRSRRSERDLGVAILGSGVSVVSLNLVWEHYYLLLIPLTLYAFRTRGAGLALATLALLPVLGRPVGWLVDPQTLAYTGLCIAGGWVLLALGARQFAARERSAGAAPSH